MRSLKLVAVLCVVALFIAGSAFAQQMPNPYGPNINLAAAKKVAAAAAAKAAEMKINVCHRDRGHGRTARLLRAFRRGPVGQHRRGHPQGQGIRQYKRTTLALENVVKANVHT